MADHTRRTACDRCRGQKLRCERGSLEGISSSCERCAKARAQCVTSLGKRAGRPRQQTSLVELADWNQNIDFDAFSNNSNPMKNKNSDAFAMHTTTAPSPFFFPSLGEGVSHGNSNVHPESNLGRPPFDNIQVSHNSDIFDGSHGFETKPAMPSGHLTLDRVQRLSSLHSELLRQLSDLSSVNQTDWLNVSRSFVDLILPAMESTAGVAGSDLSQTPVARMLASSRELLDVFRLFPHRPLGFQSDHPANQSSCSKPLYSDSSESEYEYDEGFGDKSQQYANGSRIAMETDYLPLGNNLTPAYSPVTSHMLPNAPTQHSSNTSIIPPSSPNLPIWADVPTILSLFSCYITLVRVHSLVFSKIHDTLVTYSSAATTDGSVRSSSLVMNQIDVGNVNISSSYGLQIKILLQVSLHLLEKVQTELGLPEFRERATKGHRRNEQRATTIERIGIEGNLDVVVGDILVAMEKAEGAEGERNGLKGLRKTVKDIRREIRQKGL